MEALGPIRMPKLSGHTRSIQQVWIRLPDRKPIKKFVTARGKHGSAKHDHHVSNATTL